MVDEAGDDECPICFDIFTDAVVTPCSHCFCQECLSKRLFFFFFLALTGML
jgi:hypothetical protein